MATYLVVDLDVRDAEGFQEYHTAVPAMVAKHGGEYLVRGGDFEVIEGTWQPRGLVVIRFPDRQAFQAFYDDPAYAALKTLRHRTCDTNAVAVDGVE